MFCFAAGHRANPPRAAARGGLEPSSSLGFFDPYYYPLKIDHIVIVRD
jgi:hypothetical protein